MYLGGGVTGLVQEIEDLCKGNNNIPKQLLYKDISVAGTGHANRGDIYNVLGGPILVILYHTNAASKAAICRKSVGVARTNNMHYTRASINLVMATIGGIKSQSYHIAVISYYNNIHIVLDDHFLLLRYKGL